MERELVNQIKEPRLSEADQGWAEKKETQRAENIMGTLPIGKLLCKMGIPLILSLLVQALYSTVDSMYVAWLGGDALTAISLCMTPQYLIMAIGTGIGVGVNTLLSSRLGQKDDKGVNRSVGNGLLIVWVCSIAFILLGVFLCKPFFTFMTDLPSVQEMSISYGSIICIFAFASFHQVLMERTLVATGRSNYSMISMLLGSVINIILDPILMFGWLGFPAMGIAGAAYATVIAQGCAAVIGFCLNHFWNKDIRFSLGMLKAGSSTIYSIVKTGLPVALSLGIISLLTFGVNGALLRVSAVAPAIYVIYFRLQSFMIMPADGMRDAGISIIAYNYSIKNKKRIMETLKKGLLVHLATSIIGIVLFWTIPDILLKYIFNASGEMIREGVPAFRIISIVLPFAGGTHVLNGFLQALESSDKNFIVSIVQAITLIGGAWALSMTGNVDLVWLAFSIMETVIFTLTAIFVYRIYKEKVKFLREQ